MPSRVRATLPWKIQLPIESLEARQLLSAHVEYDDWIIDGTDAADTLIIQLKPGTQTLQAILNAETYEVELGDIYDLRINLGAGDDHLVFQPMELLIDDVSIFGGDGNDSISGSSRGDFISGESGDDVILGRAGEDNLNGGLGDDMIIGGSSDDEILGGPGEDSLFGGFGQDSIDGNGGNDLEFGGRDVDILAGNVGNDTIQGGDGGDIVAGGIDDDQLKGGKGDDQIDGSFGLDLLWGGGGRDTLHGGAAADDFDGGSSADSIYRQSKLDRIRPDKSDTLQEEELSVPLVKQDAATLKESLINAAVANWQYSLGDKRAPYSARRYYDRDADGKLFQVDPNTGEPTNNSLLGGCSGGGDYSQTNVQEEGVDEADSVKTDGKNLYLLDDNNLIIMNALPADDAHILSTTEIEGEPAGLYLKGSLLTVLSRTSRSIGDCPGYYGDVEMKDGQICIAVQSIDQVKVTVYDVSQPAAPTVVEENLLDGSLNTSRVIDGKLYLVLYNNNATPAPKATWHVEPPLPPDWNGDTREYGAEIGTPGYVHWSEKPYLEQVGGYLEYESEASYRKRLSAMSLDELAPSYTSRASGGKPLAAALVNPNSVYSGKTSTHNYDYYDYWRMSSVVALDPSDRKPGIDSSAAIAGVSGEIYVARNGVYLASSTYETPMGDWQGEYRTDLYKFKLDAKGVDLVASGAVPGNVINSFAMDEQDGRLRIATTSGSWAERSSNVFVLEQHGQSLQVEGGVSDLGFTETIRSARFDGDRGYIVTFLRQDPLFVIDLSDPVKPRLSGELEIPGFSSYLHPIADHRLIGVGQNGDENGSLTGLQVSLFDVSDPTNPTRPANFLFTTDDSFDWTASIAQNDHHAFAYFPQQEILAIPVSHLNWDSNAYESTVYLLRIGKSDITLVGKIPQKGFASRNVRIGENLYAISSDEVKIVELANPENQIATIQLPGPPANTTPWFAWD